MIAYSFLFRKNFVFLGVVFASAFGFEMYVKMMACKPAGNGVKLTEMTGLSIQSPIRSGTVESRG